MSAAVLSDRQLRRWYRDFNRRFFGGCLPSDADVLYAPVDGAHGDALVESNGEFTVRINPACAIDWRIVRMTLLHEMAHLKLWPYRAHGERFEKEMQRLACAGAFKGLW
ncbi:MAG TPA: SprT-like domain-containing protein [Candidatus Aquilonibacter sp.]|nr:SprT-like domain-containing protein [Candidatus Aquilonibacter sp.]